MKLKDKDKEMFKELSKSQMGQDIADYLERLSDSLADVRNQPDDITRGQVLWFIKYLKDNCINHIKLQNEKKERDPNQFV